MTQCTLNEPLKKRVTHDKIKSYRTAPTARRRQTMHEDTQLGGGDSRFPQTAHTAVLNTRSQDAGVRERAFGRLVQGYWKPIYKHLRIKWRLSNEQAKDSTQAFFAHVLEKGVFAKYEPGKAAFRTYVRMCLDAFVSNELKAGRRQKRGGGRAVLSLEFDAAEDELIRYGPQPATDPAALYEKEWIRTIFSAAVERTQARMTTEDKTVHFALFERYDLADEQTRKSLTYDQLAKDFDLSTSQVTNHLAAVRRVFRAFVLEEIRDMTGGEAEFESDARRLLGVRVS